MAKAILAVSGKGGVGKTTIAAALIRLLIQYEPRARILAIDADPAVGLSTALGVEVLETLDDIRKRIVKNVEDGQQNTAIELLNEARFRIFDTMVEEDRFSFLAIGRPEGAGCYCTINSYLKEIMTLLAKEFDYVVVDGEAGIEQINRRVMEKVSHLLLISDQSRKGIQVAKTIKRVADEMVMYEEVGLILNRVTSPELMNHVPEEIPLLNTISVDLSHAENDICGRSVFTLDDDALVIQGVREALLKLKILPHQRSEV